MSATTQRPRERLGFAAVVLLTLAPVVLQGLWRPLAWALHAEADSTGVTGAALVLLGVILLSHAVVNAISVRAVASMRWPRMLSMVG